MAKKYHIWTEGCQMNVADSQRVSSALEHLGFAFSDKAEEADVIVLNTCVVRKSAEDKAYGRLQSLRPLKESNPDLAERFWDEDGVGNGSAETAAEQEVM